MTRAITWNPLASPNYIYAQSPYELERKLRYRGSTLHLTLDINKNMYDINYLSIQDNFLAKWSSQSPSEYPMPLKGICANSPQSKWPSMEGTVIAAFANGNWTEWGWLFYGNLLLITECLLIFIANWQGHGGRRWRKRARHNRGHLLKVSSRACRREFLFHTHRNHCLHATISIESWPELRATVLSMQCLLSAQSGCECAQNDHAKRLSGGRLIIGEQSLTISLIMQMKSYDDKVKIAYGMQFQPSRDHFDGPGKENRIFFNHEKMLMGKITRESNYSVSIIQTNPSSSPMYSMLPL